jgi:hypothetical protein
MGVEGVLQFIANLRGAGSIYRCSQWKSHTDRRTLSVRASFIEVTPISTAADTLATTGAVVAAVATGAISPEEGQAVAGVIEFQRRAMETNDLAARIEALERGAGRP